MNKSVETVKVLYAAFSRGDIPAILSRLADDVEWDAWPDNYAAKAGVGALQPRRGKAGVADFFKVIGQWKFNEFEVRDIMAGDRQIAAHIFVDYDVPRGGKFRDEEIHLWTFDAEGKVKSFKHFLDTAKLIAAHPKT